VNAANAKDERERERAELESGLKRLADTKREREKKASRTKK
jgi:hypothetical protein